MEDLNRIQKEKKIRRELDLLMRTGEVLVASGADTSRILRNLHRTAAYLGLPEEKLEHLITKEAKLWLDSGKIFGGTGAGFQRINVAAPRAILTECLERIRKIL